MKIITYKKNKRGMSFKGQLISECLFDVLNFPKNEKTKKIDKLLPRNLKIGQKKR